MVVRQAFNLLKAPLMAAGRAYNATAQRYPMYTGVVTTVAKTSAADLFAQKVRFPLSALRNLEAIEVSGPGA
jgi:hypothetical protein